MGYNNNQRANFLDFSPEICYNVVNNIFGGMYVGQKLRQNYENGLIKNSDDFMEALKLCVI